MKRIFITMVLFFIGFYMSAFVVLSNQVGLVVNRYNGNIRICTSGVHFMVPFVEFMTYVSFKSHTDLFTKSLTVPHDNNNNIASGSFMIEWHVNDPVKYYQSTQNSPNGFFNVLQLKVSEIINNTKDIKNDNLLKSKLSIDGIGVTLDRITLIAMPHNKIDKINNVVNDISKISKISFQDKNAIPINQAPLTQ